MTRIFTRAALGAALALGVAGAAGANDSTAELATGGLVLTKTDAIEMKSEDLFISEKQVRVDYRFLNISAQDVTVTVAFPMPDITTDSLDNMIAIPTASPTNLFGFATLVDGKPAQATLEQRAFKDGIDRTALLQSMGVPLAPHLDATNKAIEALPQAKKDQLEKLGLAIDYDSSDKDPNVMEKHYQAIWTLKSAYYWRQTFPAGREISVHHSYTPSIGSSSQTQWGSKDFAADADYAAQKAKYCVDDAFLAAAARRPGLYEERIDYILTSGANWKAPIGHFHLVVDKGAPANLVSFCGEGVKKISPTQFEVDRIDFTPTKEIAIVILGKPSGA